VYADIPKEPEIRQSDTFIRAINSPQTLKSAPRSEITPRVALCSCVIFAKLITDFQQIVGYAKNWPINTSSPEIGGVVITNENPKWGHVAVIKEIKENSIIVDETNYKPCAKTTRELSLNDPAILGFWSPEPFVVPLTLTHSSLQN
jgi:hypothetical protein